MTKSKEAKKREYRLLTVNLTAENYDRLKVLAERMQKPMAVIVRELLIAWLAEQDGK
jgi:predicted DNA-binding protein